MTGRRVVSALGWLLFGLFTFQFLSLVRFPTPFLVFEHRLHVSLKHLGLEPFLEVPGRLHIHSGRSKDRVTHVPKRRHKVRRESPVVLSCAQHAHGISPSHRFPHPHIDSPLDRDVVRALIGQSDSEEFNAWLHSASLLREDPVLQPYEVLADHHLRMDMERYLQVRGRIITCACMDMERYLQVWPSRMA